MEEYANRNETLLAMGFKDYRAYLRSKLWRAIRRKQLEKCPDCYGCSKPANQVHHTSYDYGVLNGESNDGLFSLCARCHMWVEVTKSGYKRTPTQATKELERIHRMYAHPSRLKFDRPIARLARIRNPG